MHNGIRLYEDRIERLEGRNGMLQALVFASGQKLPRTALFFDGTRAAFGINKTLTREDFAAKATGSRKVQRRRKSHAR